MKQINYLRKGMIISGITIALASFLYCHLFKTYNITRIENGTQRELLLKDESIKDLEAKITQAEAKNTELNRDAEELKSPKGSFWLIKKQIDGLEREFAAYREKHPLTISAQEYDALIRAQKELKDMKNKCSKIETNIANFDLEIKNYKKTHPESITQEAYDELQEQAQEDAGAPIRREMSKYKKTHPEQITSDTYAALRNQISNTNSAANAKEQEFAEYTQTHNKEVSAAYAELEKKVNEVQKQLGMYKR